MKKPFGYLEKDIKKCRCGKPLKKNLVVRKRKDTPLLCYACYVEEQGRKGNKMKKG
jgi:hypothetical protein